MSGVFVQGGLGLLLRMVLGAAGLGGWCCGCRGLALGMVLGLGMGIGAVAGVGVVSGEWMVLGAGMVLVFGWCCQRELERVMAHGDVGMLGSREASSASMEARSARRLGASELKDVLLGVVLPGLLKGMSGLPTSKW